MPPVDYHRCHLHYAAVGAATILLMRVIATYFIDINNY